MTGIDRKVFLRALSWLWDRGNRRRFGGDMTEWSLWHLRCQPLHTMTKAPLENTVSWSLIDSPYSVFPLSAPLILNLMGVIQSKCTPSQAFLACCPLRSLPELHLHLLPRSSSGYILCFSQDTPLVPVFLLSVDLYSWFQRQCRWR